MNVVLFSFFLVAALCWGSFTNCSAGEHWAVLPLFVERSIAQIGEWFYSPHLVNILISALFAMRGHRHGDDTLCRQHHAANIVISSAGFGVSRKRTLHNIIIWHQELFSITVHFLQPFQPCYYHSCLLDRRCCWLLLELVWQMWNCSNFTPERNVSCSYMAIYGSVWIHISKKLKYVEYHLMIAIDILLMYWTFNHY